MSHQGLCTPQELYSLMLCEPASSKTSVYWALGRDQLITEQVLDVSVLYSSFHLLYAGPILEATLDTMSC